MNDERGASTQTTAPSSPIDLPYRPLPVAVAPPEVSVINALKFGLRALRERPLNTLVSLLFFCVPFVGMVALSGHDAVTLRRLRTRHAQPVAPLRFRDFSLLVRGGFAPFIARFVAGSALSMGASIVSFVVAVFVGMFWGLHPAMITFFVALFAGLVLSALLANILVGGASLHAELTGNVSSALNPRLMRDYLSRCWKLELTKTLPFVAMQIAIWFACNLSVFLMPLMLLWVPVVTYSAAHLRWQCYERYIALGGAVAEPNAELDPPDVA